MSAQTNCPDCGADLDQANYDEVHSAGYPRPTRVDYDLVCPSCPYTRHVVEHPSGE